MACMSKIESPDTDTLIVWTEQNGIDMALSFQEAEGCNAIWCVLFTRFFSPRNRIRPHREVATEADFDFLGTL